MDPDDELLAAIHAELQARLAVALDAMLDEEFAGPCAWTGLLGSTPHVGLAGYTGGMPETPTPEPVPAKFGRISVRINEDTALAMSRLVIRDRNATEVVRRAVALLDLVQEQSEKGLRVGFIDSNDRAVEVVRMLW